MGDFLVFERFVWFDRQVRQKRFPNARKLADHFELSRKTAQRNIDFMRDRLIAPLEYDPSKKGYYYLDETFGLGVKSALDSFQFYYEQKWWNEGRITATY